MSIFSDFKEFISKGNVLDLAVAIVIGSAFGKIIASLVEDILMPPLGMIVGQVNFNDLKLILASPLSPDKEPVAIKYGSFITQVVDFLIIAFAIFMLIKIIKRKKDDTI